jgi:mannitol-1-/sugar-/sorbitol-6-phosphatase
MPIFGPAFDAFLFDMDGTILTSIPAVERAWTAWANRAGVPADKVLHYMHGRPGRDTISHFAPPGTDITAEVDWLNAREMADTDGIAPIPGAQALLTTLPADRWAVVTSANRALARMRIAAAGLPLPRLLISSDDVTRGKPDPEGYQNAARQLGRRIDRCLVIEDTATGLLAGLSAGASVLRVLGTPGSEAIADAPAIGNYLGLEVSVGPEGLTLARRLEGAEAPGKS